MQVCLMFDSWVFWPDKIRLALETISFLVLLHFLSLVGQHVVLMARIAHYHISELSTSVIARQSNLR